MKSFLFLLLLIAVAFAACESSNSTTAPDHNEMSEAATTATSQIKVAHLASGDTEAFENLRTIFAKRNPGYDMAWFSEVTELPAIEGSQVVFVQSGGGTATLSSGLASKVSVGDIVMLKGGEGFTADSALGLLSFYVPETPSDTLPTFIRPDWDPNITDVVGGCATETGAYRRILLTWLGKVGPYLYHSLNAHRVRIMDSFTHYHPVEGGFDEFYLVQMAMPGAQLITSEQVDLVEAPANVTPEQAANLLQKTDLSVGDLIYLPRGTIHRGVGGVLAQVITVPGFIPKSEIGVDHHLRAINERLGLVGEHQLPYNKAASLEEVVK